jgi:hypothetical protein
LFADQFVLSHINDSNLVDFFETDEFHAMTLIEKK